MEIIILDTPEHCCEFAANSIAKQIKAQEEIVLGLATGSTQLMVYKKLIEIHNSETLSYQFVTTFNLDEYIGIDANHPQSYRSFMQHNFFEHIDILQENTYLPDCHINADYKKSAACFEAKIIECGGVDIQLLGLGSNGHIGFNEPSSSLRSRTRVKTLTQSTIDDNKRFFKENEFQPQLAMTMGIGTILDAKKTLLIAYGKNKANAVRAVVEGPLTASCPGSALQLHNDAVIVLDMAAASELENTEYYHKVSIEKARLS